jgi:DNA-directed RNA polymerase subunit RPC12/RpoP
MTDTRAVYGKCPKCSHVFFVIQLPAPLILAAGAMQNAACTECGTKKGITIAHSTEVPSNV